LSESLHGKNGTDHGSSPFGICESGSNQCIARESMIGETYSEVMTADIG
jgi:hypothetical protein